MAIAGGRKRQSALKLSLGIATAVAIVAIGVAQGANGDTILISRSDGLNGETAGHRGSDPSISADGRTVVFISRLDPTLPGSTAEAIYARDHVAGTTRLVSRAPGADGEPAAGPCCGPAISADGRFVVFTVQGSIDHPDDPDAIDDVFVRDLETNTTTLVSRADGLNGAKGNGNSGTFSTNGLGGQAISADGRFVAFTSAATNLDPLDDDSTSDVFVRDLELQTTTLVSRATGPAGAKGDDHSGAPSISADGTRVAFASRAGNLDPGDTDSGFFGQDIFMRDLEVPETKLVSRAVSGDGDGNSFQPAISANGDWVAFASSASNLTDDTDTISDVFVHYFPTEATVLVSRATSPTGAKGSAASSSPAISGDGRYVAFQSSADNLGLGASGISDVFVRDLQRNELHLASRPDGFSGQSDGASSAPAISGDGDLVAFTSLGELTPAEGDFDPDVSDVYVRDMPFVGSPAGDLSIEITRPADGARVNDRGFRLAGRFHAPFGITGLCATVGQATIPADCDDTGKAQAGGTFAGLPVRGARNGTNEVTAWIRDANGNTAASDPITVQVGGSDLSVSGLDITQGIQAYDISLDPVPAREPAIPFRHPLAGYRGVPLVEGKKTIVRMYTETGGGCLSDVHAVLHAFSLRRESSTHSNWRPLAGSPLFPMEGARRVCSVPLETQRPTPSGPGTFNFVIPDSWLQSANDREIRLVGEVNPTFIEPRLRDPASTNNARGLSVDAQYVHKPKRLIINPVRLAYGPVIPKGGTSPISGTGPSEPRPLAPGDPNYDPAQYFREFIDLAPFDVEVRPWQGGVSVGFFVANHKPGSDMCGEVLDELEQWEDRVEISDRGFPIELDTTTFKPIVGLFDRDERFCGGIAQPSSTFIVDITEPVAIAAANRPLTSVAHETSHQLGLAHAGTNDECYENAGFFDYFFNESWAFDDRGTINGWGLDINEGSGAVAGSPGDSGPFAVFGAPGTDFAGSLPDWPSQFFDYMSYCANEATDAIGSSATDDSWLSVRNWITLVRGDDPGAVVRPARGAEEGPTLRVTAILSPEDAVSNLGIAPGALGADPPADGSPYRVVVRNAAGAVVSDTPVAPRVVGVNQSTEPLDSYLEVEVAAGGAQTVQLIKDGTVLAERSRSANSPQVKVLSPTRKTRVGPKGSFAVSWEASDADGDPLETRIEFSANGGKSWRPLTGEFSGTSATVPASLLQASENARIRIRTNDGFNESVATSAPFRAAGPKPLVRLTAPSQGTRVAADSTLQVAGEAFDDRGFPISGKSLRWMTGKKLLARGESAQIPAAEIRKSKLTLVARDRNGKTASKSITLKIERVAPIFTKLGAPRKLGRKARRLTLTIASTIPAKLTVSGKGVRSEAYRVGPRASKVSLRVKPGKKTLKLKLRLGTGKKTTEHSIRIKRN